MFVKIPINIFPSIVAFSFNQTDEEVIDELSTMNKELTENDLNSIKMNLGVEGRCVDFGNGIILIRMRVVPTTLSDYRCLQHEIMHAVIFICNRIEVPLLIDVTDEVYSHLVGFLTYEIYNHLD